MGHDLSPPLAQAVARARAALPPGPAAYLFGAAADGHTDAANAAAWAGLALWPRVLREGAGAHTRVHVAGRAWAHPIGLAPVALQRLAHPDGELASAAAAAAQGALMVLSEQSSTPVEQVARAFAGDPQAGPLWFQLHARRDRGLTRELAERARAAGCQALVLTVDAPVDGVRDEQVAAGYAPPPGVAAVHLAGHGRPQGSALALAAQAATWDDVAWLAGQAALPLWLKGVLHPDDAHQATTLGVAGLVVSNHGGRVLDTTLATAHALPLVADAVGGRLPLLVDGGIRRGTDVLKALALGAQGVLLGRPQVAALALGGAVGVAQMLRRLRDEFEAALVLSGCASPGDVSRRLLVPTPPGASASHAAA